MKFIVSSSTLAKQLQHLSGVLASGSGTIPILDNFLFEINKDTLTVTASDLETTMVAKIAIKSEEKGSVAIPGKILIDTLKSFPDVPVTFTVHAGTHAIELSAGEGKYKLSGLDGTEFPKVPAISSPSSLDLPGDVIANGINKCLFATSSDELRPVMCGVYMSLGSDGITFVATDAHRLVRYTRSDVKAPQIASFILPKKPLNLLKNILTGLEENIKIVYNQTNAYFAFNNIELTCRLVDGKYPNYEAVIPKENPNKLLVDKGALTNCLKRVSIFSNKTTHQVRFKITGNELHISAEDLDYSNEANERLTGQYSGEDIEIGFNSKFLIDMLNNLQTDTAEFEMSMPNRAVLILPHSSEASDENLLMLVMPVMLNN
jgi:DNA polymerase-3 subunit beta